MTTRMLLMAGAMALAIPAAAEAQNSTATTGNITGAAVIQQPGNAPRAAAQSSANPRADARGGDASSTGTGGAASAGGNSNNDNRSYAIGLPSFAAGSGPCIGSSTSVAAGAFGFGGGVGRTEIEEECQLREAARLMHSFGATSEALALIRGMPSVRKAQSAMAQATAAPAPAPRQVQTEALEVAPQAFSVALQQQTPAWCDTVSPIERPRFRQQCGF